MFISDEGRAKKAASLYKNALICAKEVISKFNDELQASYDHALLNDVIQVKAKLLQAYPINANMPYQMYAQTIGHTLYELDQRMINVNYAIQTFTELAKDIAPELMPYQKHINCCRHANIILGNLSCALSTIHKQVINNAQYQLEQSGR
jgi:hypothetical protein